ncbi:hypothetical protein [Burkholderia phage BCSR5]|nr:hypothetical protein [Burkholderia phage BCSR5]
MRTIKGGQYKVQTNTGILTTGELGIDAQDHLVTKDLQGNLVTVGNPDNSTSMTDLKQQFAEEVMDISSAKTLGSGYVFLNGTSYDGVGLGIYEFEERDGRVYGLYGRTDGVSQQVFLSGGFSNAQDQQYTTVPYVPPFLVGNSWQAQSVCGTGLASFCVQLRDTTPGSTASPRYIYVRHNNSLINLAGHSYVEITDAVNYYLQQLKGQGLNITAGIMPTVSLVGEIMLIAWGEWSETSAWLGAWNSPSASMPWTTNPLPSVAAAPPYNPSRLQVASTNWPGGEITTGELPSIMGNRAPGGMSIFKIYNVGTGQVTDVTYNNFPQPIISGWSSNNPVTILGDYDDAGNYFVALGTAMAPGDALGNGASNFLMYSLNLTFNGTPGQSTQVTLNYPKAGQSGTDLHYVQDVPFLVPFNPNVAQPREDLVSDNNSPVSKYGKLPLCAYHTGYGNKFGNQATASWYYSGAMTFTGFGGGTILRGVVNNGAERGSKNAARHNKVRQIWPMFNVVPRSDFSPTGSSMSRALVVPSGKASYYMPGHFIAPDTILSPSYNNLSQLQWTVSKLPPNSNINDASYNRFGTAVSGFKSRVAEYLTNLPSPGTTSSTYGCLWSTNFPNGGDASVYKNFQFPVLSDAGYNPAEINGANTRYGDWTFSNGVYNAPPVNGSYHSNILGQLAALKPVVINAAKAAYTDTGTTYHIEVVPVINQDGTGVIKGFGILWAQSANNPKIGLCTTFTTPMASPGGIVQFTDTTQCTIVGQNMVVTNGIAGPILSRDNYSYGRLFVMYAYGISYAAWTCLSPLHVSGDALLNVMYFKGPADWSNVTYAGWCGSQSRAMISMSAQHNGMAKVPYRDGFTVPTADVPLSLYQDTDVGGATSFMAGTIDKAMQNPSNLIPGGDHSYNLKEMLTLQAIAGNYTLQIGAVQGRLNHKQYSLPSTFIDMNDSVKFPQGTYYLYLVDPQDGTPVHFEVDTAQRPESNTNMYFGRFTKDAQSFSNQVSVSEVVRFGTARLANDSSNKKVQGSSIRVGPYVG